MAFPYVFKENFESGDKGTFDGTTVDGGPALTFQHARVLSRRSDTPMPFRGAFLPEINLATVDSSGTYFLENTAFDHAGDVTRYLRFYIFVTTDLVMATSDVFDVFALRSASANEVVISIRNNAGAIEIGAGETAGTTRTTAFSTGRWHCIELALAYDGAADGNGLIDFYVDGLQVGAQITGLTQAASTNARFGVQAIDAGTTAGRVYLDQIIYDDGARLLPTVRHPNPRIIYDSEQLWIGPGHLDFAAIVNAVAGTTPNVDIQVRLYDTENMLKDILTPEAVFSYKVELSAQASVSITRPVYFEKGCYCDLSIGTDPIIQIAYADYSEIPGVQGPLTVEDGALRNYLTRSTSRVLSAL